MGDLDASIVAALITAHSTTYATDAHGPSVSTRTGSICHNWKKANDQQCVLQVQAMSGFTFYQGSRTIPAPPK